MSSISSPSSNFAIFESEEQVSEEIKRKIRKEDCPICMDEDPLKRRVFHSWGIDGVHSYHEECLVRWVDQCAKNNIEKSCPTCKKKIDLHDGIFQIPFAKIFSDLRSKITPALKKATLVFLTIFVTLNVLPLAEQKTYQWLDSKDHYNPYVNFTQLSIATGVTYLAQETGNYLSKTAKEINPNKSVLRISLIVFKELCKNTINIAAFSGAALAFSFLPFYQPSVSNEEQLLFFTSMLKLFAAATCLNVFIPWFF